MTAHDWIFAGYEARRSGRGDEARTAFKQGFKLAASANDRVDALRGWANSESDLGRFAEAANRYGEAIALLRGLDDPLKLAHTIRHSGDVLREAGRSAEALACYEEALGIYREHPEAARLDIGNALRGYGLLLEDLGQRAKAHKAWEEVLGIYGEVGVQAGIDEAERRIAALAPADQSRSHSARTRSW